MSTEALRGTSRHQFLGCRNELSAQLEMDRRKGQNGFGGRLRHQTRCDPSGSNLYRRSYRLGSVNHRVGRSRARSSISGSGPEPDGAQTLLSEISRTLRGAFFDRRSRLPYWHFSDVSPVLDISACRGRSGVAAARMTRMTSSGARLFVET